MNPRWGLTITVILACLLVGCARQSGPRAVLLNTPAQLASNGFALLDADKLDDAEREFKAASFVRTDYAAATVGLAVVQARGATTPSQKAPGRGPGPSQGELGVRRGGNRPQELAVQEARPDWLATVETAYSRAVGYMPGYDRATFVLASAYLKKYLFSGGPSPL